MTSRNVPPAVVLPRAVWLRCALVGAMFVAAVLAAATQARADASLVGVHPILAAKARAIVRACGSRVISGVRHTRVAGTRRLSLHASGRAVDLRGDPRCIYARLKGWPGGYSTDYGRVRHVHVSLGGAEQGRRFVHRAAPRRHRYVHRPHLRARPLRLAATRS